MYSYNRIHNDYDNNVVRVELNSSYRPRSDLKTTSREPMRVASSVNRNDTFTKRDRAANIDRPAHIIRSDTFILKHHHDESSDERPDYNTYSCSKKKIHGSVEKKNDDRSNYSTYTRSEKRGSCPEKSLYINTDTYRKPDKKRSSSVCQESENLNTNTFTKTSKPKRVESLIKRFDMSFWRRNKDKSPSPSGSDTIKRSKNIFNLMSSGKQPQKSFRDVGTECKMDEDRDYYSGMGTRKSSIQSLLGEKKSRPLKTAHRYDSGSNQQLTGIIKSSERRYPYQEKKSMTPVPAPIRVELAVRNVNKYESKKPIGIASPLPQARNRSVLKNGASKNYDNNKPTRSEIPRSYAPVRVQEVANGSNFNRENSDRMSFREYREKLKMKNDNRRITDNSDDELRKSYQQSFFVPM